MATDEQMMQALRARRGPSKALFIGAGVLLLLVAVAVLLALHSGTNTASRHFSALSRCLIGPPLAAGENVFFRLREAQLGAKQARSSGADAWPARCSGHATALYRSIDSTGKSALLKRLLAEQLGCSDREPCKLPDSGHPLGKADEIWKAASIAGLEVSEAPEVAMPEPRLKPEHRRGWPALGDGKYSLTSSRVTGQGELWLLFSPPEGAEATRPLRFCRVTDRGSRARCLDSKKIPALGGKIDLVDDLEPPAVVGTVESDEGSERAAFSLPDGAPVKLRMGLRQGHALDARGKDLFLLEIADGTAQQIKLPFGSDTEAAVLSGWLAWFESETGKPRKLALQKIGAGPRLEGEKVYLEGEIPSRMEPCPGALYGLGSSPAKQTAWFAQGGGWSKPVAGSLPDGPRDEWSSVCAKDRVSRFWVDKSSDNHKLGMLDCRPRGCERREVEWTGVKAKRWLAVTALGDQAAALYETFDEDKRLHLAPFAELSSSLPIVITDSAEFSGEKFESPRVIIAPDFVVVVFSSEKSLHGLFVNREARGPVVAAEG